MAAPPDLQSRLRELLAAAGRGGMPAAELQGAAAALVGLLLERDEYARLLGPRLDAIRADRALVALAHSLQERGLRRGELIAALRARCGVSRAKAYRLLRPPGRGRRSLRHVRQTGARFGPLDPSQLAEALQSWPAPSHSPPASAKRSR